MKGMEANRAGTQWEKGEMGVRDHLVGHCKDFGCRVNGKPLEDFEQLSDVIW